MIRGVDATEIIPQHDEQQELHNIMTSASRCGQPQCL